MNTNDNATGKAEDKWSSSITLELIEDTVIRSLTDEGGSLHAMKMKHKETGEEITALCCIQKQGNGAAVIPVAILVSPNFLGEKYLLLESEENTIGISVPAHKPFILTPNDEITEVFPANGKVFSLSELQAFVGNQMIQIIDHRDGDKKIVMTYDGKSIGLPLNRMASNLYEHGESDPIVGTVLVTPKKYLD